MAGNSNSGRKLKPRRQCACCDTTLYPTAQGELCLICLRKSRTPEQRYCRECDAPITRMSRTGRCAECYHGQRDPNGGALIVPIKPVAKVWCSQCERSVRPAEGQVCASRWCGARASA